MMSPICSMLMVKLMMSVQRRLSSSPSASREISRQVVLDRRVELVHRVVELAQLLRPGAGRCGGSRRARRSAWSRRCRPGAAPRARRSRSRAWAWTAPRDRGDAAAWMAEGSLRLGQQVGHQLRHPLREADEAHADDDVEGQVKQHHAVRRRRQIGLHVAQPQADEGRDDRHAQRLEQQVADA